MAYKTMYDQGLSVLTFAYSIIAVAKLQFTLVTTDYTYLPRFHLFSSDIFRQGEYYDTIV